MSFRPQTTAIIWAQWRSLMNRNPLTRRSIHLTAFLTVAWYALWAMGALSVASLVADSVPADTLLQLLTPLLFLVTLYWQFVPVLLASSGVSLDLRRLIVYPIRRRELFGIEVALRVSAAAEMLIICCGVGLGLVFNRAVPVWSGLILAPFVLFNLLVASAVRDLLARLMARKHVREVVILCIVLLSALPQLLVHSDFGGGLSRYFRYFIEPWWPWSAAAHFAAGRSPAIPGMVVLAYCTAAYFFARVQFDKTVQVPAGEMRARERASSRAGLSESLYVLPGRLLRDPLGALVEKELRTLARSSRFRLVFIMAFTFGLIIWLPLGIRRDGPNWMTEHYLTVALAYAVILLSEVMIWNIFGFDRKAVQVYFAFPVRASTVLIAKNLSALFFTGLNGLLIVLMCAVVGFAYTAAALLEAASVMLVVTVFLIAIGNLMSVRNPRPVDPDHSWGRTSAGRFQAVLLLVYPAVFGPIALAFLARSAFETDWAFYGVLAFDFVLASIVYWVAFESAIATASEKREEILGTLSREQGVLSS